MLVRLTTPNQPLSAKRQAARRPHSEVSQLSKRFVDKLDEGIEVPEILGGRFSPRLELR